MKNRFRVSGNAVIIFTKGFGGRPFSVKIDRADLALVQRTVRASIRCGREGTRKVPCVIYRKKNREGVWVWNRLSRLLKRAPSRKMVDHENHDPLDNRRKNLRIADHSSNGQNRLGASSQNKTSGKRNVYWSPRHKQWQVRLRINGIRKFFGYHRSLKKAAEVAKRAREKWMPFCMEGA